MAALSLRTTLLFISGVFLSALVSYVFLKELYELRIGGVFPLLDADGDFLAVGAQRMVRRHWIKVNTII
jgi:hypothetical protein